MFVLESFSFKNQNKCLTDKDRSTTEKNATEFIFEQILTVSLLLSYNLCNHSLSEAPSAYFIQQFNRTFSVRSRILVWRLFFPLQPNVLKVKYEMYNICILNTTALKPSHHPTLGDRAFQSAAPYLWNALPSEIRNMKTLDTFKTAVKTHFFNLAFK